MVRGMQHLGRFEWVSSGSTYYLVPHDAAPGRNALAMAEAAVAVVAHVAGANVVATDITGRLGQTKFSGSPPVEHLGVIQAARSVSGAISHKEPLDKVDLDCLNDELDSLAWLVVEDSMVTLKISHGPNDDALSVYKEGWLRMILGLTWAALQNKGTWTLVARVAQALAEKGRLSGAEFRALVGVPSTAQLAPVA